MVSLVNRVGTTLKSNPLDKVPKTHLSLYSQSVFSKSKYNVFDDRETLFNVF